MRQTITILLLLFLYSSQCFGVEKIITNVVFPCEDFVGREEILKDIDHAFLEGNRIVALEGISGVGKTQISREYIRRVKSDFDIIWVFDFSLDMKEQYKGFANYINQVLCTKNNDCFINSSDNQVLGSINSFLENTKLKLLIVFDNFNTSQEGLLPNIDNDIKKRFILVSRESPFIGKVVKIPLFKNEESIQLLKKHLPNVEHRTLQDIANKLNNYPIAIKSAAKGIKTDKSLDGQPLMSFQKYLKSKIYDQDNLDKIVFKTLESFEDQKSLLKVLSSMIIYGNHNIDAEFILKGLSQQYIPGESEAFNFVIKTSIISEKRGYGDAKIVYEMHDYLAQIVHKYISKIVLEKYAKQIALKFNNTFPNDYDIMQEICNKFPHFIENISSLNDRIDEAGLNTDEIFRFKINLLKVYNQNLNINLGKQLLKKIENNIAAKPSLKLELARTDIWTNYLAERAFIKSMTNNQKESIDDFKEAIECAEYLKNNEPILSRLHLELAQAFVHTGESESAKEHFSQSYAFLKKPVEQNKALDIGMFYYVLAKINMENGDYRSAENEINRGINYENKYIGTTAYTILSDILKAEIFIRKGEFSRADKVITNIEKNHLELIKHNAAIYSRYLYIKSLIDIQEGSFTVAYAGIKKNKALLSKLGINGDYDRGHFAQALISEGDYFASIGKPELAIKSYSESLRIYKNIFSSLKNDTVSLILFKLALNYNKLGDKYNFILFKNMHEKEIGVRHSRSKDLINLSSELN